MYASATAFAIRAASSGEGATQDSSTRLVPRIGVAVMLRCTRAAARLRPAAAESVVGAARPWRSRLPSAD